MKHVFKNMGDADGEYYTAADYDALAAELAGYKESHDKYCPSAARIRELETALREVRKLAGERDGLIDICRVIDSALETKAKELDCRHGIPRSLCSECPTSDRGAAK